MANQTIDGLTSKTTPVTSDELPIWDVAGSATKKITLAALGTAVNAGVASFNSRTGAVVPASADYTAAQVTNAADKSSGSQQNFTGELKTPDLVAGGLTGATAASRYVGATTSGPPASGTFAVGDFVIDQTGILWVCVTAGTSGTWASVGGLKESLASNFTNASASQNNTNLAFGIVSGIAYAVEAMLVFNNSVAGDGAAFTLNNSGTSGNQQLLALSDGTVSPSAVSQSTLTNLTFSNVSATLSVIHLMATLNCTGSGTLTLKAGPRTFTTGTFTLFAGSWMSVAPTLAK